MTEPTSAVHELRRAGLRVTEQRAMILGIIRESAEHLDAEEIYAKARARSADLSLATVYRTVRALREARLVEQRYFGPAHGHEHYESAAAPEHFHFTCTKCGRVLEFETPLVARLRSDLERRRRWQVREAILSLSGRCGECRADEPG